MKIFVILALVLGAVVAAWWFGKDEPKSAAVGDCMAGASADELHIVDCGDAKVTYEVVGKIDSVSQSDWKNNEELCSAYTTTSASYWEGEEGKVGYVLCLKQVTK